MRGFPNRLSYPEFCSRYTILDASKIKASGLTDPKKICEKLCTDFVDKERFREKPMLLREFYTPIQMPRVGR